MIRNRNVDPTATIGYEVIPFDVVASVGNNVSESTAQAYAILPFKARLVGVQAHCTAKAGTTDPTVDVYDDDLQAPASVLSGDITLAAANTVYNGIIASPNTEYPKGRRFSVRCATNASDGGITKLKVNLIVRGSNEV